MTAPKYMQKELQQINPRYFAVYDEPHYRWRIRKWKSIHQVNHKLCNWVWDSDPIMNLEVHEDLGMGLIHAMNEGFYNARNVKRLLQQIDDSNDTQDVDHAEATEAIGREMATSIWKRFREPMVDLGAH